jgi:hypothetical protein
MNTDKKMKDIILESIDTAVNYCVITSKQNNVKTSNEDMLKIFETTIKLMIKGLEK